MVEMNLSCYKITDPAAVKLVTDIKRRVKKWKAGCEEFAKSFGGEAVFRRYRGEVEFVGIRFDGNQPPDADLWRIPCGVFQWATWPRVKPPKGAGNTARLRALTNKYELGLQQAGDRPSYQPFYRCISSPRGGVPFYGLEFFCDDDAVFIRTHARLNHLAVEITADEFEQAKERQAA